MRDRLPTLPDSLMAHRVVAERIECVCDGEVRYDPVKSLWFMAMATAAAIGGIATFTWPGFAVFLEYTLVYLGVQVGLAGPIGLLRQHELRDYAQRLPACHDYLRHARPFWQDAWWQLHCSLQLRDPPRLTLESRIADDRFYRFLERTWMAQQLPPAVLLFAFGGWGFVFWGVCARVTAGVFGHWIVGFLAHNHGAMNHAVCGAAVQGRNVRFASLLTMGECWHNNHHAFPGSARLGLLHGEWDPGWWALCALRRLGLVWKLRLPSHLETRPEVVRVASTAASDTSAEWIASLGSQSHGR